MAFKHLSTAALTLAGAALATSAHAGKTLDAVKARGQVVCGVNTSGPGFSSADSQGKWSGLDVDFCRAVAAAVLKDADKVKYVPLNSQQRFSSLQAGEIDVLSRNSTWTLTRDASLGVVFTGINYFDGQGFMVPKKLKIDNAKQAQRRDRVRAGRHHQREERRRLLRRARHEVQVGRLRHRRGDHERLLRRPLPGLHHRHERPRRRAHQGAEARRLRDPAAGDLEGAARRSVRRGDDEWFEIVRWTQFALLEAEENGLTQANVDQQKSTNKDPGVQRILGVNEDMGKLLGLDAEWAYRIVKQVGNYGESFERNLGSKSPLNLPRGANNLWTKGGLMYAPPIR